MTKKELSVQEKAVLEKLVDGFAMTPCYKVTTLHQIGYKVLTKEEQEIAHDHMFFFLEFPVEVKKRGMKMKVLPSSGLVEGTSQNVIHLFRCESKKVLPIDEQGKWLVKIVLSLTPKWDDDAIYETTYSFEDDSFSLERASHYNQERIYSSRVETLEKKQHFRYGGHVFARLFLRRCSNNKRGLDPRDITQITNGWAG